MIRCKLFGHRFSTSFALRKPLGRETLFSDIKLREALDLSLKDMTISCDRCGEQLACAHEQNAGGYVIIVNKEFIKKPRGE